MGCTLLVSRCEIDFLTLFFLAKSGAPIKITLLPENKEVSGVAYKTTPLELAEAISKEFAREVVVARVNGDLFDLFRPLERDSTVEFLTFDTPEGKKVFWHSSAHILGQALERKYHCHLCIGPALDEGFYYDAALPNSGYAVQHYSFSSLLFNTATPLVLFLKMTLDLFRK